MIIDEELIKKEFGKILKTDPSHFYMNGTKVEIVECKKIDLLNLFPSGEENGVSLYRVDGRGSFCETYGGGNSKECSMNFATTIKVDGDDIVDVDSIKVTLK